MDCKFSDAIYYDIEVVHCTFPTPRSTFGYAGMYILHCPPPVNTRYLRKALRSVVRFHPVGLKQTTGHILVSPVTETG